MPISSKLLQEICDQIATEINAIVSIIGQRGEIVASSKRQRIGDIHDGAAKVIAGEAGSFEVTADHAARSTSMLEGITLPIEFDGQRVFCVAVAAPLDIARQYCRIVQYWVASHLRAAQSREKYENDLQQSEQRFRDVAESAGDWIWEMDADLRFTYLSPRFFELFPVAESEIIGKTREGFAGRELTGPHWQHHNADLAARLSFRDFAYSATMSDGIPRQIQISGKAIHSPNGQFCGYRGTGRDVTELNRATIEMERTKRLLELSEQRFRDVAESAGDWIWEMDADLRFTYLSPRFFDLFPVQPDNIIGKTRAEFAGKTLDEPHWQAHYATLSARLPFRDFAYNASVAGGRARHIQISGKPVIDQDGAFTGYRGTGRDVTEQVEAEAAQKQSEQRLTSAIEVISEGFSLYDKEDRLVTANDRYREMLYPEIEDSIVPGTTFTAIIRAAAEQGLIPEARGDIDNWVAGRLARHQNPSGTHIQKRENGRWIQINERKAADGGTVAVYMDITELKENEAEITRARDAAEAALADLKQAQARLVQAEKMASLGQLTAGIAHEIKNPLNFVNNFANLSDELLGELAKILEEPIKALDAETRDDAEDLLQTIRDNLTKINEHGKRADSIVKNMLLHSREGPSERQTVGLNEIATEALNLAYHSARAENPKLNIGIVKTLAPEVGEIECYPQELTRVLLNLISNGIYAANEKRAAEPAGFAPSIVLTTRQIGAQVEVEIRDNGTGIPPEVREKIFNPFFTTKPAGEGTGLGLSLSFDIVVKQHGGELTVESEPGEFTAFRVTLPRSLPMSEGSRQNPALL